MEDNNFVILVLYRELEIALAQYTADGDVYGTGLIDHTLFR